MSKTVWMCEICQRTHETKELAEYCEASHIEIVISRMELTPRTRNGYGLLKIIDEDSKVYLFKMKGKK